MSACVYTNGMSISHVGVLTRGEESINMEDLIELIEKEGDEIALIMFAGRRIVIFLNVSEN